MKMSTKPFEHCVECDKITCYKQPCQQPACNEVCRRELNSQTVEEVVCRECIIAIMLADQLKKRGCNG